MIEGLSFAMELTLYSSKGILFCKSYLVSSLPLIAKSIMYELGVEMRT